MTKEEAYMNVIDIMFKEQYNERALLIEIAKQNPEALVTAAATLRMGLPSGHIGQSWQAQVIPLLQKGSKFEAVRVCRQLTGMGIKEAKEAVEAINF